MTKLVWDEVGSRTYETGVDRGVLYLADGSAVPWNGLTSIAEQFDREVSPVYYDGQKINDRVILGDFAATLNAITYPPEFSDLEGLASSRDGISLGDQKPKLFNLSWRTMIGNDTGGEVGYKIHLVYNATAVPSERAYTTISAESSAGEFSWNLTAIPVDIDGFRPTAHLVIDSTLIEPRLLADIEEFLYGTSDINPTLLSMDVLLSYISGWVKIQIIDNGDGTWTAIGTDEDLISVVDGVFTINEANANYVDPQTYEISDTVDED